MFALKNEGIYLVVAEVEILSIFETDNEGNIYYTVRFDDGSVDEYMDSDLFDSREKADVAAARLNEERDQIWHDAAEDSREWMWS